MLNALINKPNHVPEKQRLAQSSHKPIYYRLPRSNLYMGAFYTGFTVAMIGTTYGIFSLIKGKPT